LFLVPESAEYLLLMTREPPLSDETTPDGGNVPPAPYRERLIRLAPSWEEARFVDRPNRFTLLLRPAVPDGEASPGPGGKIPAGGKGSPETRPAGGDRQEEIRAYLPNTGRLEEYCVRDGRFFVAPFHSPRFRYRVVSAWYQGSYVLVDTAAVQRLAERLAPSLLPSLFPALVRDAPAAGDNAIPPGLTLRREHRVEGSRFDLALFRHGRLAGLLEIKSCTLCHRGVAMFPDAPSSRALDHLRHLRRLGGEVPAAMLFLVPAAGARVFVPNAHTDPAFAREAAGTEELRLRAFAVPLRGPVTADAAGLRGLPVDLGAPRLLAADRGSYLLVLRNDAARSVAVGSLGKVRFPRGYYVYAGSGMNGLQQRIRRHLRAGKKARWHIDYLATRVMPVVRAYPIRSRLREEQLLAGELDRICTGRVPGFGSSDSPAPSHLFYFTAPPHRMPGFQRLLLDRRTAAVKNLF
jgi:sugar fermentation stimulation protein A